MDYLPLCFDLRGRPCLLAGDGAAALSKARLLHRAGAVLHVAAAEPSPELQTLARQSGGICLGHPRTIENLTGMALVVAATGESKTDRRLAALARDAGIPVNAVDDQEASNVIFPAIVDRSPLLLAISSSGAAPTLARIWRRRLEEMVPVAWGHLAALAGRLRGEVHQALPTAAARRRFWERVLDGPAASRALTGQEAEAEEEIRRSLDEESRIGDTGGQGARGEVYLVGGGPGDPELLTLRAVQLMQRADIVFYDRLVSPAVLERVRREAQRVHVGKENACHPISQEQINTLLIRHAREGRRVLRLKGGDPFLFGRGGEEIHELTQAGIPFEVAPGITAASGCAAYAGIPLTHRDYAHSVCFLPGHPREGRLDLNWAALARPGQTLVFYMSSRGVQLICESLIQHGRAPQTPAALVERGTTREQRVVEGSLADLPQRVAAAQVRAPTLTIVGEVVQLRKQLHWLHR